MVDNVGFLDVTFDKQLNWNTHAKIIREKCRRRISVLKAISGITWGAHPSTMLKVYRGWIRAIIEYGCQAFAGFPGNFMLILDRIQF